MHQMGSVSSLVPLYNEDVLYALKADGLAKQVGQALCSLQRLDTAACHALTLVFVALAGLAR